MNSQQYLESFVECSGNLPTELTRLLATVKDLDERSHQLRERIDENVADCLAKPPQAGASGRKAGNETANEVAELRSIIEADQQMLLQFAEEKLALSCQCYDLVDMHLMQIDRDIEVFEAELQAQEALEAGEADVAAYAPEPAVRSKRLKAETDRDRSGKDTRRRDREDSERRRSEAEDALRHQAAQMQQLQQLQQQQQMQMQQMQQMQMQQQQAVVAAHQAAAQGYGSPYVSPTTSGSFRRSHFGSGNFSRMDDGRSAPSSADDPAMLGFQRDLPPGLSHSSETPQAAGRLLLQSDIGPTLEGRQAEMFWPDDNAWYLVDITSVDMSNHRAMVIYTTGETEEIDLDEIVRDKHMSLIQNNGRRLW